MERKNSTHFQVSNLLNIIEQMFTERERTHTKCFGTHSFTVLLPVVCQWVQQIWNKAIKIYCEDF